MYEAMVAAAAIAAGALATVVGFGAGVIAGTLAGRRVLARVPEAWFHTVVAVVVGILGVAMLVAAAR